MRWEQKVVDATLRILDLRWNVALNTKTYLDTRRYANLKVELVYAVCCR